MWTIHLNGGPKRVNHAAVTIGNNIYSFGGYCSGENYSVRRPIDVHILNTMTLRWTLYCPPKPSKKDTPYLRYGHSAIAQGNKVYLWGGRDDESACNKLYRFDTECFEWSCIKTKGIAPRARDGHSACIINNDMYIFGGFEDLEDRYSQDLFKLDLITFTWSYVFTKGESPTLRDFHTVTAIDNRMYVFGGRGDLSAPYLSQRELYCNKIMYLDVTTCKWVTPATTGNAPVGRRSHSAFVYKEHIYIFGGYNSLKNVHFNDLHRFNPYTACWEQIKPLGVPPSKRRRQSCVVSDDRMFLFGGTSPIAEYEERPPEDWMFPGEEPRLKDHDDLHVLEFEPTLRTFCLMAVINYKLDVSTLPEVLRCEINIMTTNNGIQRMTSNQG